MSRPPLCSGSIMLGPKRDRTGVVIRGSVAESSTKTASPPSSWTRTGEPGAIAVPTSPAGSSRVDATTISMPPSSSGWRITPADASLRTLARSATVIRASEAFSPVSRVLVTAAAPSIQRSRCRALSYSRALPIAMPACAARTRSSVMSVSVKCPVSFSAR